MSNVIFNSSIMFLVFENLRMYIQIAFLRKKVIIYSGYSNFPIVAFAAILDKKNPLWGFLGLSTRALSGHLSNLTFMKI